MKNKLKATSPLGASNHSRRTRVDNDFYETPRIAVERLLESHGHLIKGIVWEPACGRGAISKLIPIPILSTDLLDYGYGTSGIDFLSSKLSIKVDTIITNPPYNQALEFVLKSLEMVKTGGYVIMLLRTLFLEGVERYDKLFSLHPPKEVLCFSGRISCLGDTKGSKAISFSWFIWEKGYKGKPLIGWIRL